ncbi:MAG: 50S ribosomal protein L11 methyltransferase [Cyanobium sp.]
MQRRMVGDEWRTLKFQQSIQSVVQPGMVLIDIGAGSGILSCFAAQAGAERVYAVEREPGAIAMAKRLIWDNGFTEIIRLVEEDAERVWLPEKADVIVSEWLGAYGVDENMLRPVLVARDRWLKPEGVMIPATATAWLAPVDHPASREAIFFAARPYDLNLGVLDPFPGEQAVCLANGIDTQSLAGEPQMMWETNCSTMAASQASKPYVAHLTFQLSGPVSALAAWFSAEMPGIDPLSNAPGQPRTHWGIMLFPVASALSCKAGDRLHVEFHCVPGGPYGSNHIWAVRVDDGPLEVHDTRRSPRAGYEPPWRVYDPNHDLLARIELPNDN